MIVFPFKRDGVWEKIAMLVTTYELPETHVSLSQILDIYQAPEVV